MKNRLFALLSLSILTAPVLASAQDAAYIEKLERRLMAMEQKMYNQNGASSGNAGNPAMLADLEARLQQLEEEASRVYGAVEELGNTVEQFAKKMEVISKDFDMRLQDIEKMADQGTLSSASTNPAGNLATTSSKLTDRIVAKRQAATPLSIPDVKTESKKETKGFSADMPAKEHYDKAYKMIIATQYKEAEEAMKLFLERHDGHELAENAYYWLGEVYLVQSQPEKAVITFSKGLAKFPKGSKAPGNLLKMGTAFKQMKKNDFAKSSWEKLINDYPNAAEVGKAKKELEQLK